MRRLGLFVGGLGLVAGCAAEAENATASGEAALGAVPERVTAIAKALEAGLYACPDRIWPENAAGYAQTQVLFTSRATSSAYLVNDRSQPDAGLGTVTSIATTGLDPAWFASFNIGRYNGVTTLGVSLDDAQKENDAWAAAGHLPWHDSATRTAFHEGFHFLSGQLTWPAPPTTFRHSPYPEPWKPRYLNRMLESALLAEVRSLTGFGAKVDLGAAAHWRKRLENEWSGDIERWMMTAVREGSARYAELLASAVASEGCGASEDALYRRIAAHLDDNVFLAGTGDLESYDLGLLAGLLLRGRQEGWESKVVAGAEPVAVLLQGAAATQENDAPDVMTAVEKAVRERNADTAAAIEPLLEHMASTEWARIAVPTSWVSGSLRASGFFELVEQPGHPLAVTGYRAVHQSPAGERIEALRLAVLQGKTPCAPDGAPSYVLTVPLASFDEADGLISADTETVKFTGLSVRRVEDKGKVWVCPTSADTPAPPRR